MSFDEINTFLAVAEFSNIARAADQLYIGQGTASSRILRLEEELGIQLFVRQKGMRNVVLTPEGEYFLPIAQQMLSLWQQAQQIKNRLIFRELRIAAIDTLNRFFLSESYCNFMENNPDIQFYLQTEHSTEIHQLIENQQIDIGFVCSLHKSPNVIAKPLFREKIVLIYHAGCKFESTHNFIDLLPQNEIYLTMGTAYDLWHQRRFPKSTVRKISIGTNSMLPEFLRDPQTWTITTQETAEMMLLQNADLRYCPITEDPPPERTAYLLLYKYPKPWINDLCTLFLDEVVAAIRKRPYLELLYEPDADEHK